ncbi:uncharacterized protein LOC131245908 [Magnolia sinica]|uniref:uncharacterized protein LOC131245908 n=1 Tax=Magnolia sinica TaxID=86752 RepID=UPI002659F7E3|nr:uncharacterized protein LOC131245908 [Magnolia sinica]
MNVKAVVLEFLLHTNSFLFTPVMSTNKVPVLCRFGGDFVQESSQVYYVGGMNRIIHVDQAINYVNLLSIVRGICQLTDISIKYKYPDLDLDSIVSIQNDSDVSNMIAAFSQSSNPIQLFVFCAQQRSISTANPSNLTQIASDGNDQAMLRGIYESNEPLASCSHDTKANNDDVPSASNDLMDDKKKASSFNEMLKMTPVLKEGQEFEDVNAFHKALREYAIRSNFEYKRTKSGHGSFQAKCTTDDCLWRIHARQLPQKPTFKIKSLKENHTCNAVNESTSNTRTHRHASSKWIAGLVKDRIQKKLTCTPKDIVDEIRREYGIKVTYDKAWRGKELALKEIRMTI